MAARPDGDPASPSGLPAEPRVSGGDDPARTNHAAETSHAGATLPETGPANSTHPEFGPSESSPFKTGPSESGHAGILHEAAAPSLLPGRHIAALPADFLLLGFFLILFLQHRHRVRRRQKAWKLLCQLIAVHQNTLAQRQQTCLTEDHYGIVHKERWEKELAYFCQSILLARLEEQNLAVFWPILKKKTLRRIKRVIKIILKRNAASLTQLQTEPADTPPEQFSNAMDPLDYERFCASMLRHAGWQARPTPPGSDQGVDVLAEQNSIQLVIQCKLYSRPVGNKAVQEIFTARQHRHAQYAAVVSNAGYTRPARQLAHATGVHLLHHSQLSTLSLSDLQPAPDLFQN